MHVEEGRTFPFLRGTCFAIFEELSFITQPSRPLHNKTVDAVIHTTHTVRQRCHEERLENLHAPSSCRSNKSPVFSWLSQPQHLRWVVS